MTENDDTFAGTSARSTKHSAREDDELKHEVEGMIRAGRATHSEEWKDPEPGAEGEPDVDSSPADTLVGGVPVGMSPDAVAEELSRLPADDVYERIGDVVRALGYPTET
jgi:hypothetical protein